MGLCMVLQALDDSRELAGGSVQLAKVREGGFTLLQLPSEHFNVRQACTAWQWWLNLERSYLMTQNLVVQR